MTQQPNVTIDVLFGQAIEFANSDRLADAVSSLQEILRHQPEHGEATRLLGVIAHRLGDFDRAERLLRQSLRLGQESAELLDELGRVFVDKQQWEQAAKCYQRSYEQFPGDVVAVINLGFTKHAGGDFAGACEVYERGLESFPDSYELLLNLASIHRERGSLDAALRYYNELQRRFGDTPAIIESRGRVLLQQRRWVEGWRDYEARLLIEGDSQVRFNDSIAQWNGEPLACKSIFVVCEQGIGDEVQFASCFADLIQIAGQCMLGCSKRLEPIFARSFPGATILPLSDHERLQPQPLDPHRYDYVVAAGSLPRYFRDRDDAFLGQPYLKASADRVRSFRVEAEPNRPSGRMRVGVSWWGGALVGQMKQRSIPFELFRNLFAVPGVDFVNLQHGRCDEQAASGDLASFTNLRTHVEINPYVDLDGWMDLIASLDLVISVDNSNAHFAGALGVETWLLLPEYPNWRWPYDLDHSPWYRDVKFVRRDSGAGREPRKERSQPDDEWAGLIAKVARQLAERTP